MRNEYDFSKAERGKFHRENTALNLPVYLTADNRAFVEKLAARRNVDVATIVNELLRTDRQIADMAG